MIVALAICLCLIAFGWLLPLLVIPLLIAVVLTFGGILLGAFMYWAWKKMASG